MKVAILLLGFFAVALGHPQSTYTTKYDGVDIEMILRNPRLLNNYVNCLLDKGKCTPDGTELKTLLPDAILSECSKCNPKQKEGSERVITFLVKEKPDIWAKLAAKYDPQNTYRVKLQQEAAKRGITLP
ncbi:hypothetical protein HCN44_003260 [Aphidius gifuensis]|uniref:Chemosensory protein n=1 Tax=Aphidius gifuensis TaxID=684658 RepID=A0A835CMW0_APHGI|nr:allergen Tha p 1-like [Aphidius gifuensis]KAF7987498.1 hypothetical protein HCN44_003260 [Aphidius gifuensis]